MGKYYILNYEANWADEMNVEGFEIVDETEYQEFLDVLEKFKNNDSMESISFYIGSNEEMCYESKEALFNDITIDEISKEEFDLLSKRFGRGFGFTDGIDFIYNYVLDMEDEDDYLDDDDDECNPFCIFKLDYGKINPLNGDIIKVNKIEDIKLDRIFSTFDIAKRYLTRKGFVNTSTNVFRKDDYIITVIPVDLRTGEIC